MVGRLVPAAGGPLDRAELADLVELAELADLLELVSAAGKGRAAGVSLRDARAAATGPRGSRAHVGRRRGTGSRQADGRLTLTGGRLTVKGAHTYARSLWDEAGKPQ
jgi:hypothetical protein